MRARPADRARRAPPPEKEDGMSSLRLALIQMQSKGDARDENVAKALRLIECPCRAEAGLMLLHD